VSTEAGDDGDPDEEARVVQNLEQECRSRFENFDFRFEPNPAVDTVEEGDGPWELR
jgi:hypothetical protein